MVVVTRAGSRIWGETYTRPPKFVTTTAVGGRAITGSGDLALSRELFFVRCSTLMCDTTSVNYEYTFIQLLTAPGKKKLDEKHIKRGHEEEICKVVSCNS